MDASTRRDYEASRRLYEYMLKQCNPHNDAKVAQYAHYVWCIDQRIGAPSDQVPAIEMIGAHPTASTASPESQRTSANESLFNTSWDDEEDEEDGAEHLSIRGQATIALKMLAILVSGSALFCTGCALAILALGGT